MWLPLTAVCIIVCGVAGRLFGQRFRASAISASVCVFLYLSYYWIRPEFVSMTASSPKSHFLAGELMKTRAQFYPDWSRAYEHYKKAAAADYPPALCAIAHFHSTGYMGLDKDIDLAIDMYQRAADLGDAGASRAIEHLTSKRKMLENKTP